MSKKQRSALTAETREIVLKALARRATNGSASAAKVYLDEYRAQNGAGGPDDPLLAMLINLWDTAAADQAAKDDTN